MLLLFEQSEEQRRCVVETKHAVSETNDWLERAWQSGTVATTRYRHIWQEGLRDSKACIHSY
jgi:hypothetical protein